MGTNESARQAGLNNTDPIRLLDTDGFAVRILGTILVIRNNFNDSTSKKCEIEPKNYSENFEKKFDRKNFSVKNIFFGRKIFFSIWIRDTYSAPFQPTKRFFLPTTKEGK